jgi:DNA-binding transcriptional regulator YiaG
MKARQIKALRTRLGLTQTEFFDRLGMKAKSDHVKRQTIHRWETGERNAGTAARALLAVLAKKA